MTYDVRMTLSSFVLMSILSITYAQQQQNNNNYFGCPGCCGYVAGAAGWACCRVRGVLYSTCVNNSDCLVQNSQCILGCCQCPSPFYRQNSCQQCELIPRVLGTQCIESSECAKDIFRAICVNGVCQCASAYKSLCLGGNNLQMGSNNLPLTNSLGTFCQCVPRVLGDQCSQSFDCSTNIENSECSGSTCQCEAGFSPNTCGQCIVGQPLSSLAALGVHAFPQLTSLQQQLFNSYSSIQNNYPQIQHHPMGKRNKN